MKHTTFWQKYAIIIALLCAVTPLWANNKHEVRAVWVTTIGGLDWPHSYAQSSHSIEKQKTELRDMLNRLKLANINTILLQTRVRATTIYPSAIEPWDGCMSGFPGRAPGYDPLAFAIEECHKRGMELHAWVVCIPIGKWNNYGCKQLRKRRPDLVKRIGDEGFVDPEKKASADYIADICGEIAQKYDIDGIHLDYIRYPETWKGRIDVQRGRENITRIVERVNEKVKSQKPWVKMSCSPVGKHDDLTRYSSRGWNARTKVCQDAQAWLAKGLMDQLYPMMYFQGNQFYPFALDWNENRHEKVIAPGLGIYFLSPKEKNWDVDVITRQLHFLSQEGMGHAFFRCKFLLDDVKGLYGIVKDEINRVPSLIPPMTVPARYTNSISLPQQPTHLTLKKGKAADRLTWVDDKAFPQTNGDYHLFNIYASETYPVDTENPNNLMATRLTNCTVDIPQNGNSVTMHYAVTATDRYGRESKAATTPAPNSSTDMEIPGMLSCDGKSLRLPRKAEASDAEYIAIESAAGNIITTRPYSTTNVDVRQIPQGFYVVRSLNRKGASHRMGFFIIRRD
ncbi:MAG: glycoside hydrolase family 10 protein [Prevotella sp.]